MKLGAFWIATAACAFLPLAVFAHGVEGVRIEGGTGVATLYSDGTPMAFADVIVYAPDMPNEVFQEGMTDREGRFVFHPPVTGKWLVEVDDGMGHALRMELDVADTPEPPVPAQTKSSPLMGAVTGIGAIFGLFGCWALWRERRGSNG